MSSIAHLTRAAGGTEVPAPGLWRFDPGHSEAAFAGTHLLVNTVRGRFAEVTGHLLVAERPEDSTGELTIQAASLWSGSEDRDEHLRSQDWLDVANHPTITFASTGLEFVSGRSWRLFGDLTVRGVGHAIEARAAFGGAASDPWGHDKIGFSVKAEIDRERWGMNWNAALPGGGFVVSRWVWLTVDVEAVREPA